MLGQSLLMQVCNCLTASVVCMKNTRSYAYFSVLGLLLSQGAEWKNRQENVQKECKIQHQISYMRHHFHNILKIIPKSASLPWQQTQACGRKGVKVPAKIHRCRKQDGINGDENRTDVRERLEMARNIRVCRKLQETLQCAISKKKNKKTYQEQITGFEKSVEGRCNRRNQNRLNAFEDNNYQ